jgi:hypothetical protein
MPNDTLTAAEVERIQARVEEERAQYYSTSHGDDDSFNYVTGIVGSLLDALDEARGLVEHIVADFEAGEDDWNDETGRVSVDVLHKARRAIAAWNGETDA